MQIEIMDRIAFSLVSMIGANLHRDKTLATGDPILRLPLHPTRLGNWEVVLIFDKSTEAHVIPRILKA